MMELFKRYYFYPGIILLLSVFGCFSSRASVAFAYAGERIEYGIRHLGGKAEYRDMGAAEIDGKKCSLVIFKTHVFGFEDTEKIYFNAEDYLPIRVEREIKRLIGREHIVEEYDQEKFTVTIRKLKGKKVIHETSITSDGPVYNAILIPFYHGRIHDFTIGRSTVFRIPLKFEVTLVSEDSVRVPAGKFQAYHFTSVPDIFEIWINRDEPRIPVLIKGKGGFGYSLFLRKYSREGVQ